MLIKKIKIENFRNIDSIELDFTINAQGYENDVNKDTYDIRGNSVSPRVFGLIGANSVGKSTILLAIRKAFSIANGELNYATSRKIASIQDKNNKDLADDYLRKFNNDSLSDDEKEMWEKTRRKIAGAEFSKNARNLDKDIRYRVEYFNRDDSLDWFEVIEKNESVMIINDANSNKQFKNITGFHLDKSTFYIEESGIFSVNTQKYIDGNISEKDILKIISIADPTIIDVRVNDKKELLFETNRGSLLGIRDLSTGTKLYLLEAVSILGVKDKKGIYLIDEIDAFMHRELSQSLITLMNLITARNKNVNFIFTTHNMSIIGEGLKYKQIFNILYDSYEEKHMARKLSADLKPNDSLMKRYYNGKIAPFPSGSFAFDNLWDVVNE